MKTESGFGGGWWKADNNLPQKLRFFEFKTPYNYLIEHITRISLKKKEKNYKKLTLFLMRNQAFNCKKVKNLVVFLKIAEFSPKTQLLYPW